LQDHTTTDSERRLLVRSLPTQDHEYDRIVALGVNPTADPDRMSGSQRIQRFNTHMPRIAVFYDSTEGQTAKIAGKIAAIAASSGHDVETRELRSIPPDIRLDAFDAIILGASIHYGKHSRRATDFVKRHRPQLEAIPVAFFSVSLSAAGKTERQQQNAQRCLDEFLSQTGWTPRMTATVAGALLYREYGFIKRIMMKMIARQEGGDTDTSRNYEYTDWSRVEEFTQSFLRQLSGAPAQDGR
jgi:menaquinone-dependent protoporphyrinogen oxidase